MSVRYVLDACALIALLIKQICGQVFQYGTAPEGRGNILDFTNPFMFAFSIREEKLS
jgi:hypothetical protein